MDLKSHRQSFAKVLAVFLFIFTFCETNGQQTPLDPSSYWVFIPYIYNPAMVGSKDFLSVGFNAAFQGKSNTQIISGNSRITKTNSGYFSSPDITEFKNIGIGASVFNDFDGLTRNTGLSASGSYQIPLNTHQLSFLSFGFSLKGEYNSVTSLVRNNVARTFYPNFDLGIYYYGINFFTGISAINLLGSPWKPKPDSVGIYIIPVSKEYFFTAGYKILISKSLNIVLEPSIVITTTDSTFNKIKDNISPIIKLYMEDFCLGSSFRSNGYTAFFAQYRYPKFYIGAFYELPQKTAYFKKAPVVELTFGINIQSDKSRFSRHSHW
jgi:type IX secretion system PorP/SprF family membrane protein